MQHDDTPHSADHGGDVIPLSRRRKRELAAHESMLPIDIVERHAARCATDIRYCGPLGGWHHWTGTHWELDVCERAREVAKQVARSIADEARALMDDDLWKLARRAGTAQGIGGVLDTLRSCPGIVFAPTAANADPWALNCKNGTLDLRTGELRPHRRDDLITRVCRAGYFADASAPRFERFMREVQTEPEVRAYLARLCGYAAIGVVREHFLGVFWGPGANGKSVLADAVTYALGDYATSGPSTLIVANGGNAPHPTDVATLVGSRFVVVHETARGAAFDASKVKLLTGGDRLTARQMRQDFFEFEPSHTLLMLSNYRPTADATDAALWRRVQLVPFNVIIPVEQRDPLLSESLRSEAAGILRWIVEGAREWQRLGLSPPASVRAETDRYRASEDVIGQFLEEKTVKLAQASVKAGELYSAFKEWCQAAGQRPVNGNDFAAEVTARGFGKVKRASGALYVGLGLSGVGSDAD